MIVGNTSSQNTLYPLLHVVHENHNKVLNDQWAYGFLEVSTGIGCCHICFGQELFGRGSAGEYFVL